MTEEVNNTINTEPNLKQDFKRWLSYKFSKNIPKDAEVKTENWLKRHWHLIYIIPLIAFCYYYIQIDTFNNNNQSLQITNQQENLIDSNTHNIKSNNINEFNQLNQQQIVINDKNEGNEQQKDLLKVLIAALLALFLTYFISYLFTAFNFLKAAADGHLISVIVLIILYSIFFIGFFLSLFLPELIKK